MKELQFKQSLLYPNLLICLTDKKVYIKDKTTGKITTKKRYDGSGWEKSL
jgi:glutamine cyclotransferase